MFLEASVICSQTRSISGVLVCVWLITAMHLSLIKQPYSVDESGVKYCRTSVCGSMKVQMPSSLVMDLTVRLHMTLNWE